MTRAIAGVSPASVMTRFDIIVVGGGHAGVEAAAVGARMGLRVALVTMDRSRIGAMSCNPAIGGLGKGHLVREVDAFDGIIARAADDAAIHYRMLNRSKGSAVWGPRVQADRTLFQRSVQRQIEGLEALTVIEGECADLVLVNGAVAGLELADGTMLGAGRVILCTGTFLGGVLFRGEDRMVGGRIGEGAATRLAERLRSVELPMARLKTGTPPRLDGRSIDWAKLETQPSDGERWTMSSLTEARRNPELHCAIARTNARTHAIIRADLHRSPLFSGAIDAQGPRYCPSIEDKIHRFGDRDGHQIFLEPEGLDSPLIYPNGISTSLPVDTQQNFLRSIVGLERVEIAAPGYAVEYDHIDPRALGSDLQVRAIPGLYCAGQINGTTGYEEAAAQGLVAGVHAACAAREVAAPELERSNSYIAVMVDDLTLHGVSEPYRMLTSRAEYRLRLRASNADTRLTPIAIELGCVGEDRRWRFEQHRADRAELQTQMQGKVERDRWASVKNLPARSNGTLSVEKLVESGFLDVSDVAAILDVEASEALHEVVEDARYATYLQRQEREIQDLQHSRGQAIPVGLNYAGVPGLSLEMVERLEKARPVTMAEAYLIRGMTPAALAALLVHSRRAV